MVGVVADKVVVELEAKLDRYNANVKAAEARFDQATRKITASAKNMERSMAGSTAAIGAQLRGLAGAFAAGFTVQRVAQLADGYTRFTNQLKVAGVEGANLAGTQEDLFAIAQKYGVELETLGTLYSRITQASKELGANSAQTMKFTNGVAAALKIQGGAASESRGALLQLAQALGSPIVRAEEFNSINEGARPILQAVATGIDRYKGSVAKLRNEVIAGKVTSQEFFQGFLKGSADLEAKAGKANLTIAASFTILNNALGKYIGETDQSLSATQQISAALITLSENLDTVVAALGVLASVLVARYIAGLVTAARATGVMSTAIFAMQARAVGAATTMEALGLASATAGRAMLAAFGGTVGVAILALGAGLYYLADAHEAATSAGEEQAKALEDSERHGDATRRAIGDLSTATGKARAEALAHAQALRVETIALVNNAKAAVLAAKAKAGAAVEEYRANMGKGDPLGFMDAAEKEGLQKKTADLKAATETLNNYTEQLNDLNTAIETPPSAFKPAPAADKKKKTKKGPKGRDPDDIARQFADDVARALSELEQSVAEVQGDTDSLISARKHAIRIEAEINARAINADKDLSAAQKAKLLQLNQEVADAKVEAISAEERRALAADRLATLQSGIDNERDILDAQQALAVTGDERKKIELRLLDLQYQEEKARLESIAANETLRDAERDAARARLAQLDELYGLRRAGVEKSHQGPGASYLDELNGKDITEELQRIQVDGLKGLEDQLTSTIAKVFELGGAFGQIANQIISDLIRIAVQKAIIAPLANMLFGGQGGGLGGVIGGLFGSGSQGGGMSFGGGFSLAPSISNLWGGRASGGHVSAGKLYRVNEGGGTEGFQPSGSGKIIPLGRMNSAGGGGTIVQQTFVLDARYGITTPELLHHVNKVAAVQATRAGHAAFDASQRAMPKRLGEMQKLGS